MPTNEKYIRELLLAYLQNTINPEQTEELFQYLNDHTERSEELLREMAENFEFRMSDPKPIDEEISNRMLQGLLSRLSGTPVIELTPVNKRNRMRWIAAAILFVIAGSAAFFIYNRQKPTAVPAITANPQHVTKDVLPGFDGAILTTAGGNKIVLDGAANGIINKEENADIIKENNQLVYRQSSGNTVATESYNTLSTMKGRKFQLLLSDGTKVWLDAASSITYPIAFTGAQRKVMVTGQVYFEVAKDASKPFLVETGSATVQVLGTHFNVNAYKDEASMKTTLLEGAVKISNKIGSSLLKPGQQAAISNTTTGTIKVASNVNVDEVMAWKNGFFQFNGAGLSTVLNQLSRWYDVDIVYEGKMNEREFEGKIGRDLNLSQVLKLLEKLQVHFRIEGNKLIVQP